MKTLIKRKFIIINGLASGFLIFTGFFAILGWLIAPNMDSGFCWFGLTLSLVGTGWLVYLWHYKRRVKKIRQSFYGWRLENENKLKNGLEKGESHS